MDNKSKIMVIISIVLILIGLIFVFTLKGEKVDKDKVTKKTTTTISLDVKESHLGYELEYDKDIIKLTSTESKDRYSLIDDEKVYFELSVVPMSNCTKNEENYLKGETKCLKLYSSCDTNEVNCMKLHDILDTIKIK